MITTKDIIDDLKNERERLLFVKDNIVDIAWGHENKTREHKKLYKNALYAIYEAINSINEIMTGIHIE